MTYPLVACDRMDTHQGHLWEREAETLRCPGWTEHRCTCPTDGEMVVGVDPRCPYHKGY